MNMGRARRWVMMWGAGLLLLLGWGVTSWAAQAQGLKIGDVRRTSYIQVTNIFYEDASYIKLRELTMGYDIPARYVRKLFSGASTAKLTLSGRNLVWWTKYRGGDPETQNFGSASIPSSVQRNVELGAYPASKSYWLTLSVDF